MDEVEGVAQIAGNWVTAWAPAGIRARKVTGWIMSHPDNLTRGAHRQLAAILAAGPELASVQAHVSGFAHLTTQGQGLDADARPRWESLRLGS